MPGELSLVDPQLVQESLGRLLVREESTSDLIALLATLDRKPLLDSLRIDLVEVGVSRERIVTTSCAGARDVC